MIGCCKSRKFFKKHAGFIILPPYVQNIYDSYNLFHTEYKITITRSNPPILINTCPQSIKFLPTIWFFFILSINFPRFLQSSMYLWKHIIFRYIIVIGLWICFNIGNQFIARSYFIILRTCNFGPIFLWFLKYYI